MTTTISCDKCGSIPARYSVILPGSVRMTTGDKDLCDACYATYTVCVKAFFTEVPR